MSKRPKLYYNDMRGISEELEDYIATCGTVSGYHAVCVGHVLMQHLTRVQKQSAGLVRETYRIKLTPAEQAAILWVRNDLHRMRLTAGDNGIVRLLLINR